MSSSRLVPYILVPPIPEKHRKRRGEPHPRSPSPTTQSSTQNSSPKRKKRKISPEEVPAESTPSELEVVISRPPSSRTDTRGKQKPPPASRGSGSKTVVDSDDSDGDVVVLPMHEPGITFESFYYDPEEDEEVESKDMLVDGETPPTDDGDDVPVRFLDDFCLYKLDTKMATPLEELIPLIGNPSMIIGQYGASGLVKPWLDDSSDSEDEASDTNEEFPVAERVALSPVIEFSIQTLPDDAPRGMFDIKLYIRTKFAWYILGRPSIGYSRFFEPFFIRHRLLHALIAASLEDPGLTMDAFVEGLEEFDKADDSVTSTMNILGRELNEQDINTDRDATIAYFMSNLPDLIETYNLPIRRVPVVKELVGREPIFDSDIPVSTKKRQYAAKKPPKIRGAGGKVEVKTYLTPTVNRIVGDLFKGTLEVAHHDNEYATLKQRKHKAHHFNPDTIAWGERLLGDDSDEGVYKSVIVDGTTYEIGDIVMVVPDPVARAKKKIHTANSYGDLYWFCVIRYFFGDKMMHGHWLTHGGDTILQEIAHSKSLYLLSKDCNDIPIASIFQMANVKPLRALDEEVPDDAEPNSNDFHCGLMYNTTTADFLDLPPEALARDCKTCYSCDLKAEDEKISEAQYTNTSGLKIFNETYHVNDFVFVLPRDKDSPIYDIAQIQQIEGDEDDAQVHLRYLGRYDDYILLQRKFQDVVLHNCDRQDLVLDERRLFFTSDFGDVPASRLDGKCYVKHRVHEENIETWVQGDNHFFLNQEGTTNELRTMKKKDFSTCERCLKEDEERARKAQTFLSLASRQLVGMELFSGAGGLGIGMDMSGFVKTKYAVEVWPPAARTYKRNHPQTTLYCQNSNTLLKYAVETRQLLDPAPVKSLDEGDECPPMPSGYNAEKIDFIFGGPPCQSFSRNNYHRSPYDPRSSIPMNMLSYAEHYEPSYFLLENVEGLLHHKDFIKKGVNGQDTEFRMESGMVKLVVRSLIALGYQVRYRLLQAGQYGVPQSRSRVIFWAAKRGLPLPEFPDPVYAFTKPHRVSLPTGGKMDPITRSTNPEKPHSFAPLRPRTVNEAIGDLVPFEWENPHKVISESKKHAEKRMHRRRDLGIQEFNAQSEIGNNMFNNLPGFPGGKSYATMPQNRYQRWLRRGMEKDDEVTAHYTKRWVELTVEATVNVPLRPLAYHRDLIRLNPKLLTQSQIDASKHKYYYGRLDGNSQFKCAVTSLSPTSKNQWPLHPDQKRVISVREAARAQGFPDHYIFESTASGSTGIVEEQLKQIGNAVAVPFALALGKELGKAMINHWDMIERQGSPEVE